MGFKLRREVRDLLWAGALTASERILLLELADNANDDTREAFPGMDWILTKCDLPSKKRAGEYLASIAAKWFEIRVEVGKDKNGNPLYAMPKVRTTYRFPTRDELVARHGAEKVPENQGLDACKAPENQGPKVPENQGAEPPKVPENQGPFSSRTSSPQKISSSLSPREDDRDASLRVGPQPERETVEASQEPNNPTEIHRLLLDAGCPTENLDEVQGELIARHEPRSPAWWRTVAKNGDLPDLVAEVLEALQPVTPQHSRKAFTDSLVGEADCPHGIAGGSMPWDVDGWMPCSQCRKNAGWAAKDVQPRTSGRGLPAQRSMSPADRAVAEGAVLYRKYKAREQGHKPFQNPPISAYYGDL